MKTKRVLSAVSNMTYRAYAKKYNIPLSLPILEMRNQIKQYEKQHKIKGGLYY